MKKRIIFSGLVAALFCSCTANRTEPETDLARYVNPLVGTALAGNTFPGAITPFGMIQLSPDTRFEWQSCPGYHYGDSVVYGFSHTHLSGTGCADYCDFLFMPFVGGTSVVNTEYRSPFSRESETAEAGYYSVVLDKHGIKAELTAAPRAGVQRYSFPKSDREKGVLVDMKHRDKTLYAYLAYDPRTGVLSGIRNSSMFADYQQLSFATAFSVAPRRIEVFIDDKPVASSRTSPGDAPVQFAATNLKALLYFPSEVETLTLKTSVSSNTMSADSTDKCLAALRNLEEYSDFGFDFDRFRRAARTRWNDELSRILVETPDEEKKRVFYTALYHTFTAPYLYYSRS